MSLPRLALSVRQPWAYAIVMGWKPIENRSWRAPNPALKFRGDFAIHASKGTTRAEYEDAAELFSELGYSCPPPADLLRGGIVGAARVIDIVKAHDSPWFFGPKALVLADARQVDFVPASGALGFFEWKPMATANVPKPARWMLPPGTVQPKERQGSLL
ncbi:ASCH domain-containing protein [Mesorhizobium captivum]|uniref:ASCH domain-containing protein n=1 Tax=Mesorhizobium captivum TaxID=3072319 RepID=UPI002A24B2FC|nr:ASCH domain-containing protein [Mesorhizobium sp. VK23E]MDX8513588.1 ASCH domain-containing protein [Mesorhizobium sp. VK23E]